MSDLYRCKECNLEFKTRNGLWKHNNNYHKKKETNNNHNNNQANHNDKHNDAKKVKTYNCSKCNKKFNCYQNRWRHEKKCEVSDKENDEIALLKNIIKEMAKKIENLEKSNNSRTKNKNINNGQIYNGKTINNITINAPGHEKMALTKEDVEGIFRNNIMGVIKYIEKTNFNKEKTYNHNFCATNQNGKYVLHYDQETASIKSAKKKYFYEEVINNAIRKIESAYNIHKQKFDNDEKNQIEDIIIRLKEIRDYDFNNKTLKSLFDELNLLCYNSRDIVLNTWNSMDISNNMLEVREEYKDIFLPVQEYLEIYNNMKESEENQNDSDSSDTVKPKLVIRKKDKKINKKQSSSELDL
jgi:hypothetical protein